MNPKILLGIVLIAFITVFTAALYKQLALKVQDRSTQSREYAVIEGKGVDIKQRYHSIKRWIPVIGLIILITITQLISLSKKRRRENLLLAQSSRLKAQSDYSMPGMKTNIIRKIMRRGLNRIPYPWGPFSSGGRGGFGGGGP